MKIKDGEELKDLAALALRNAFWLEFSDLVNTYLDAAKGLDTKTQEMQMGELTSIYGRKPDARGEHFISISTQTNRGAPGARHDTILEALGHRGAEEIYLNGKKIFERVDGAWMFIDNNREPK